MAPEAEQDDPQPIAVSLFVEVMDMAVASVSSFAVTDVRRLAKRQLRLHDDNKLKRITMLKRNWRFFPKKTAKHSCRCQCR